MNFELRKGQRPDQNPEKSFSNCSKIVRNLKDILFKVIAGYQKSEYVKERTDQIPP